MIYKYKINYGCTYLQLPSNSNIISAGVKDGELVVWADVTPDSFDIEVHMVHAIYTGDEVPHDCTFIGTVLDTKTFFRNSGSPITETIVYHVFESN